MPPSGPVPEESLDDIEGYVIPVEILRMDDKSLQLYKMALRDGVEKVYNLRVMVVGEFGVGKTTLTKRLLGKQVDISKRESTEGIDVYKHCCKISLDTGKWIVQHEDSDQLSRLHRLMKLLSGPDQKKTPEADNTHISDTVSSSRSDQEDQLTDSKPAKLSVVKMDGGHGVAHSDHETSAVTVTKSEAESSKKEKKDAVIEILRLINQNAEKLEKDTVKYALVSIWDFAGQHVFYTTHQIFLSNHALYLLVTDLSKKVTEICDLVEIWMNSIHTCASSPQAKIPHVVLVGTHVDKLSEKYRKEVIENYFKDLCYILKDKPTIHHLMDDIAIDNTHSDPMLEILKRKIFELAPQQPHWGEERPARWLFLEQAIMTLRDSGTTIVARSLIEEINMSGSVMIEDSDELNLFLRFHHEMGTILYFSVEGLRETIVLDPQWLIDAVKSFITANIFIEKKYAITSKWYEFEETGKLAHELIDAIWTEKNHKEFHDNKNHILLLMEKLNIIAKPKSFTEDGKVKHMIGYTWWPVLMVEEEPGKTPGKNHRPTLCNEEDYYLVPCMLQQETPTEIISPESNPEMENTSVICFVSTGNFLPPPVFHRLIGACLAEWPIAKQKSKNLIYCGCCIFNLDPLHRLTLYFKDYVIFVQVTRMKIADMRLSSNLCSKARNFISENLSKIIGNLGQSCQFEPHIRCPDFEVESLEGLIAVSLLQKYEKVPCHSHDKSHTLASQELLKFWYKDEEHSVAGCKKQEAVKPTEEGRYKNPGIQRETEMSHAGDLKAVIDQTEAVFIHRQLGELAKSVGIIKTERTSGTGFRVGPNYIMTARHVVESIMVVVSDVQTQHEQHKEYQLNNSNVHIDFSFERNSVPSDMNLVFNFETEIVYENAKLDAVILKLKHGTKEYPPPLTKFIHLPQDRCQGCYFIGHSGGNIKKTDKYNVVVLAPHEVAAVRKWSMDYVNVNKILSVAKYETVNGIVNVQVDGYDGIDDPQRILFHCSFEEGASGAPGLWINPSDGQAYVELMLLRGYPSWYYDKQNKEKIIGIEKTYLIEQGVSMKSVYDDMMARGAFYQSVCHTIFG